MRAAFEPRHEEHEAHGLDQAVLFPAALRRRTPPERPRPQSPRAIYDDLGPKYDGPRLGLEDDGTAAFVPGHPARKGMEQKLYACLIQEVEG